MLYATTMRRRRRRKTKVRKRTFPMKRLYRNRRTAGYMGMELKFYDTFLNNTTMDDSTNMTGGELNPSATVALSTIAQGDGESNRDGRRATWKSIRISGVLHSTKFSNLTAGLTSGLGFLAIVLDRQTNGAALQSETVWSNPGATNDLTCSPFRNLQQSKRCTVLKFIRFTFPQSILSYDGTNMESDGFHIPFQMFHRFKKPIVANYSGTTAVISNSTDYSLHLMGFVNELDQGIRIHYNSRLRFMG